MYNIKVYAHKEHMEIETGHLSCSALLILIQVVHRCGLDLCRVDDNVGFTGQVIWGTKKNKKSTTTHGSYQNNSSVSFCVFISLHMELLKLGENLNHHCIIISPQKNTERENTTGISLSSPRSNV